MTAGNQAATFTAEQAQEALLTLRRYHSAAQELGAMDCLQIIAARLDALEAMVEGMAQ